MSHVLLHGMWLPNPEAATMLAFGALLDTRRFRGCETTPDLFAGRGR